MFFYSVDGEEPSEDGTLNSVMSTFIDLYEDILYYEDLERQQAKKKALGIMVIEEELPKTQEAIDLMKRVNEINISQAVNTDLRVGGRPHQQEQENQQPGGSTALGEGERQTEQSINVTRESDQQTGTQRSKITYKRKDSKRRVPMVFNKGYKLSPGEKYKDLKMHDIKADVDQKKLAFENILCSALGTVFKPWDKESNKTTSDADLISKQRFTANTSKTELEKYQGLISDFYWRIHGSLFFKILNRMRELQHASFSMGEKRKKINNEDGSDGEQSPTKRRKLENQNETNYFSRQSTHMTDDEIWMLSRIYSLKVEFVTKGTIVRPGLEILFQLFYAGAIKPQDFFNRLSNILQIPIQEVENIALFVGQMKQQGVWVDPEFLTKRLGLMKNPEKAMLLQMQNKLNQQNSQVVPQESRMVQGRKRQEQQQSQGNGEKLYQRKRTITN